MRKTYFFNKGQIDQHAFRTMGVSVKSNDNPIGQFGTGLKYAIAGILRTGGKITIKSGSETFKFGVTDSAMRGHGFQSVTCNGEVLAYTTDYGKHWEPWQWFRELYSNCLDEDGRVSASPPNSAGVIITVEHDEVFECFENKHLYFLSKSLKPLFDDGTVQIFNRVNENLSIFYKGVSVGWMDGDSTFTFNFLNNCTLTEDRTLKYVFAAKATAGRTLVKLDDPALVKRAIADEYASFDSIYESDHVSDEFLAEVQKRVSRADEVQKDIVAIARKRVKIHRETFELNQLQQQKLDRVLKFLKAIGHEVTAPINFVKGQGDSLYGYAEHDEIFLTDKAFDHGTHDLAQTVLEEHVHIETGHDDETRALQQYLFRQVISLGEYASGQAL